MNNKSVRKLTIAGLLVAVAVVGSLFSIPVLGSKCSPVQHMVNVLAAVLLGPWYACGMGFAAALLRNLLGLGSLLAFPGSMIGALLCGLLYRAWPKLPVAYVGEVFGTGILGGMASYPIAAVLMNNSAAALFTFVPSFLVSTAVGAAISVFVLAALKRTHVFSQVEVRCGERRNPAGHPDHNEDPSACPLDHQYCHSQRLREYHPRRGRHSHHGAG